MVYAIEGGTMGTFKLKEPFIGRLPDTKIEILPDKILQQTIYESIKQALLEVQDKSLNEKLTVKRITEEYGINKDKVYQMFQDPKLPVQTYVKPQFVLKSEFEKYLSMRHDYLSNK